MRLSAAIKLALSLSSLPVLALADGQIFVYGYGQSGTTADYQVELGAAAPVTPAATGAAALSAPAGTHTLKIRRGDEVLIEIPVSLADGEQRSVLVTMKDEATSFVVQDTRTGAQLDAGQKIPEGAMASISGSLVSAIDGTPVAGAKIELLEPALSATTDAEGRYTLEAVPPGSYTLMIDAEGFQAFVEEGFSLAAGDVLTREIKLTPPGAQAPVAEGDEATLDGVQVTGQQQGSSEAAVEEKRMSAGVAEVISSEQMSRGGESETGAALKRVTGLSLVGGKFVYVRGLGERYSSVLLNGAQIPSPDPLRRVVPLDLFPTEVLDSVVVQKNYSADLPGEFGGGTVMLRTKEAPAARYARIAVGGNYADGSAYATGLRYRGGNDDWTGQDEVRELPPVLDRVTGNGQVFSSVTASPAEIETAGEGLAAKGFDLYSDKLGPEGSFSAALGGSQEVAGMNFSVLSALRYQHGWNTDQETRRRYGTSTSTPLFVVGDIERTRSERNVDLSAFTNFAVELGAGQQLQYTGLLLRQTIDQAQFDEGFLNSEEDQSRFYELEWVENSMRAHQLTGSHYFNNLHELAIDWQVTDARANREAPGKRRYQYDLFNGEYEFSRSTSGNEFIYEDLDDDSTEYRLTAAMPFTYGDNWLVNYSLGASRLERDRASDIRRFKYTIVGSDVLNQMLLRRPLDQILTAANIGRNGFELREVTRAIDNYNAEQSLDAVFFGIDANYADQWRFAAGVRRESNDQQVATIDLANPDTGQIRGGLDQDDWLPSLAVTWTIDELSQLRFGYSQTLSRPDFRELSPAPFFDPLLDVESSGNPNLKQTELENFDLRYEYYYSADEGYSAALFYKKFENPIERTIVPGTGELLSYENAAAADNYGVELEAFKRLNFIREDWENFYVSTNAAYIKSEVELGTAGQVQTSRNRPLEGQSKYLANLQLGYKPIEAGKLEATLLYNVFGKRIAQVGVLGLPDVYEQPFNQVDFTLKYKLDAQWTLGLRLRNLLDDEIEFSQGGLPTRIYEPGREIGLSVEWRPFEAAN